MNPPGCREVRCECHRLLARICRGQLVLRCPRCKREVRVTLAAPGVERDVEVMLCSRGDHRCC